MKSGKNIVSLWEILKENIIINWKQCFTESLWTHIMQSVENSASRRRFKLCQWSVMALPQSPMKTTGFIYLLLGSKSKSQITKGCDVAFDSIFTRTHTHTSTHTVSPGPGALSLWPMGKIQEAVTRDTPPTPPPNSQKLTEKSSSHIRRKQRLEKQKVWTPSDWRG